MEKLNKTINTVISPILTDLSILEDAFTCMASNIQVTQKGIIKTVLPIDDEGLRHQRFIVTLQNGQHLMIVQNIDLAPIIPNPKVGEEITFHGEYEWNEKGGVVHWTHHDPQGEHMNGWIEYDGKRYQ